LTVVYLTIAFLICLSLVAFLREAFRAVVAWVLISVARNYQEDREVVAASEHAHQQIYLAWQVLHCLLPVALMADIWRM